MKKLQLENITKIYKKSSVVQDFNLDVESGEFLSVLGPSGCGKTTVLRIIAGFVKPNKGNIVINETVVNNFPPRSRNIGMVFQNYALFPHMTVFNNISFGLKVEKFSKHKIAEKVNNALSNVRLSGLQDRYPQQLSGGQQQRVALARALVKNPEILLLDEPLSNLDAKLRKQMRDEIRQIQKKLGITAVFVTHDQEEALSMSDRVVVMQEGKAIQIGTPNEIYEKPNSAFVAGFIGQTNIITGTVILDKNGMANLNVSENIRLPLKNDFRNFSNRKVSFSIRPDRIKIYNSEPNYKNSVYSAKVTSSVYMGSTTSYNVKIYNQLNLLIAQHNIDKDSIIYDGDEIYLSLKPEDMVLLNE